MDKKKIEGELDRIKGRVKETVGVATGDRELEGEGKLDQVKAKIKDIAGKVREGVKDKLEDAKHKLDDVDRDEPPDR
jgi:uncharacterized protein YjbJ (UPF0337 family)